MLPLNEAEAWGSGLRPPPQGAKCTPEALRCCSRPSCVVGKRGPQWVCSGARATGPFPESSAEPGGGGGVLGLPSPLRSQV